MLFQFKQGDKLPRKINYLASAGTGKTFNLVEEIVSNYLKKGVNINQLFISTFTEKAGAELKNRIYKRLKEEIYKDGTDNLQESFYEIQNSYIGTLHSLILRILKNHIEISKITEKTNIVEGVEFDALFTEVFDEFLVENSKRIDQLVAILQNKFYIKKIFWDFYKNRWKLNFYELEETRRIPERLDSLKKETLSLLDLLINDFYREYIDFAKSNSLKNVFKVNLEELKERIEKDNFIELDEDFNKFPAFIKIPNNLQEEIKGELKKLKKKIQSRKEELEPIEKGLRKKISELKKSALYQNYLLVLRYYREFEKALEERKNSENILDYDDILIKSLKLFKEHPEIKKKYNRKFKAVLIDEFQDTDSLQIEIIKILSEGNDLIIFGDPKQCIYEWRNANLEDYIDFIEKKFSREETKDLDICFRSNIQLIGFFNLAFSKGNYDFLNKGLKTEHLKPEYLKAVSFPDSKKIELKNEVVHLIKVENQKDEPYILVKTIKELLNNRYEHKDILVLFRSTNGIEDYIKQLKINNIPFISFLESSFYKSQEVLTVLNVLRLIQYPYNQLNLVTVLKSPLFNFSDQDLINLKENLSIGKIKELEPVLEISETKENKSLSEIISEIFDKLKVFEIFSVFPDGNQKTANLRKLVDYSQILERDNFNLRDFIAFLEENRETREDEGVLIENDNFIKIMTMHKAKGLESKVVIIPNLSKDLNKFDDGFFTVNNKLMVQIRFNNKKIAETTNFDKDLVREKKAKEEKRLLYVAFTRAKEKLVLIGSKSKNKMKEVEELIKWIKDKNGKIKVEIKNGDSKKKVGEVEVEIGLKIDENPVLIEGKVDYWKTLKNGDKTFENQIETLKKEEKIRQEDYEKSVSSKRFITVSEIMGEKDEKGFLEEEQIKENEETVLRDKAIQLGILIHKVLEEFSFTKDKNEAVKELENLVNSNIHLVDELYAEDIKKDALKIVNKFVNSEVYKEISSSKILFREMPFTMKEENRYIEGIIDIVYEKDGEIVVLDYKTNKNATEEKIREKYKIQEKYYTEAVKRIFPDKKIRFKFAGVSTKVCKNK